jgi:serine/threonine protein kinase/DNA-binding SARP family transcriptional activator
MPELSLFLLGNPRLERDGWTVELERHKALALLIYLAVTGAPHRRDTLAALLWTDLDQTRARAALRRTLSDLNIALAGDWLETSRETIGLLPSADFRLDVAQFRQLLVLGHCRKHSHPETDPCSDCLPLLAEVSTIYRGDFLSGFTLRDAPAFDEWQFFETETFRRELASVLERLARGHAQRHEFETAIPYARRWLALDSLHEPAHCQLLQLYAWADQRQAALRQYAECVRLLEQELGVSPQAATTELYNNIKENRLSPPATESILPAPAPFAWTNGALLHNRYRIESELGRGGMGVVYGAHDTLLDRTVAIKVLSEAGGDTQGRTRLLREAQAVARLDHPHIVPVYDAGEMNSTPFIVMQLVDGKNLRECSPLSLPQIITLASQLCDALGHAHRRGIVHRDVKPENILVTPEGTAKLMDFGLAYSQSAARLTQEGTVMGTLAYLAPEQILGEPIDGRTDLYALGVILYELTTGRLPFTGDDMLSLISQHLHSPVEPPRVHRADLPPALNTLIVHLLSKQPADRPASAEEIHVVLDDMKRPAAAPPTLTAAYSTLDRIVRDQLVGRARELDEMVRLWNQAVSGAGQTLLISGEPGIGKTRLVRELMSFAQNSGGKVLADGCHAEGGPPYAPLAAVIRETLEHSSEPDLPNFVLADLLTLAPHLRPRYPHVLFNPTLDPHFEQQRMFDSFVTWCEELATSAPLLLLIEDVHWADNGTLALLRHLARRVRKARLLLVMTYRDTEIELDQSHPLYSILLDLNRERLAEELKLTRLNREQTRELLGAMLPEAGAITPEFLEGIYKETEGNPFFIEEVCKGLIEQGKLYQAGGTWRRADMQTIIIPPSVRGAILGRVERLPDKAQEALRLASILGREFDFETLCAVSKQEEETLIAALERAERAQLISEATQAGHIVYFFAHALIPFTLRESLSGLRRQRLHHRVGTAIETQRPSDFEALAYHFTAAGEQEKAIEYSRLAAELAQALYVYETAIQHLKSALDMMRGGEQNELRLALLESLADAHRLRGERAKAIQIYQEALEGWRSIMNADKWFAVRLHRKIGETFNRLAKEAEIEQFKTMVLAGLESALQLIEGETPHPESIRLLTTLANYGYWSSYSHYEHTDTLSNKGEHYTRAAVAMAERLDAPIELSAALESLADIYSTQGLLRERTEIALRRLALSRDPRFTDRHEEVNILCQVGTALCSVGDYAQALTHLIEAEHLAEQIGDLGKLIYALSVQIQCLFGLDRWEEILQVEDKRLALQARYGSERIGKICFQCGVSANVHGWRGEIELARAHREEAYQMMANGWGRWRTGRQLVITDWVRPWRVRASSPSSGSIWKYPCIPRRRGSLTMISMQCWSIWRFYSMMRLGFANMCSRPRSSPCATATLCTRLLRIAPGAWLIGWPGSIPRRKRI